MSCISLLLLLTVAAQAHARLPKDAPEHGPDPCLQKPVHGPEWVWKRHFFYDSKSNECYLFAPRRGIVGNDNRFASKKDCENRCKITNDLCLRQPLADCFGMCYPSYYFDKATRKCESSLWGSFQTEGECQQKCLN